MTVRRIPEHFSDEFYERRSVESQEVEHLMIQSAQGKGVFENFKPDLIQFKRGKINDKL